MNSEKICFSSKTIEIAEHDLYLELTNKLCYYDDKNLNTVMLPYNGYEELALECAKSLINMPVQAKYKKINNLDDLGSHEMRIDSDGDVVFDTSSIGTHTEVWITEDTVTTVSGDTKILPCLFAKCRIWKRNKNMISAIKRLYDSDGGLNTSWEIATTSYEYKNGTKILIEYEFLGNAFLGSTTTPAYNGTSKTISLSSLNEGELMVAEALSIDLSENHDGDFEINNNQEKEDSILKDKKITDTSTDANEDVIANTSDVAPVKNVKDSKEDNSSTETSALTSYDLRRKVTEACKNKVDEWCWVSYLFPEEREVWCEYDGESELDYLKFTYSVENDVVTVSEPEKVSLTVSVKSINTIISEYEKTIAEKDELIVKASSEITSLKSANTELSQYKEKFEQVEQEKIEAELAEKKNDLIASVIKSGQITKEEIEKSEDLSALVDNLDKKSLMAIVGERLLASVDSALNTSIETSKSQNEHVTSSLNNEDDEVIDNTSIMRKFLRK